MPVFGKDKDLVFSKPVRAGKRTYFFDVKSTRNNEYYITITESKKKIQNDGSQIYEKHKLFLYKEDLEKFQEGLNEVINFIRQNQPEITLRTENSSDTTTASTPVADPNSTSNFTDLDFDSLGKEGEELNT